MADSAASAAPAGMAPHSVAAPPSSALASSSPSTAGLESLANGFVHKQLLTPGNGHIPPDKAIVTIHYTASLEGAEFDSSYSRSAPFSFRLGSGAVIRGWDAAVASLRVGERSRFIVQPRYAYGDRGFTVSQRGQPITSAQRGQRSTPAAPASASSPAPPPFVIPPNSALTFELELLSYEHVQKATEDGGVMKRIIRHGEGHQRPNDGAVCLLRWRGRVQGSADGHYFDAGHWDAAHELVIGHDPEVLLGLEDGIRNMYAQELSHFTLRPDYGYGEQGCAALGIEPKAVLEYEVELLSFRKGVETWQLSDEGKLAYMRQWKALANASYAAGDAVRAIRKYLKVLACFQFDAHLSEEQRQAAQQLKVACHANLAMARSRQGRATDAFKHCNEALRMDPNHVKTLFRRGVAYAAMHDDENALVDLTKALSLEPSNRAIEVELRAVEQRLDAVRRRQQQAYKSMFDSKQDSGLAAKDKEEKQTPDGEHDQPQQQPPAAADASPVRRAEAETVKSWDRFYNRNGAHFFKDRHYLAAEFEELTLMLRQAEAETEAAAAPSASASPQRHLLELGCGVGNALFPLQRLFPALQLHGCDCSQHAVRIVQERQQQQQQAERASPEPARASASSLPVDVWVQDVVSESFPARLLQQMQFCTLIFVLSAIAPQQHRHVLCSVRRVLVPHSGLLYLRDYCVLDQSQLRFAASAVLAPSFYLRSDGTRAFFFQLEPLTALLRDCGFAIVKAEIVERRVENRKERLHMRRRFVQVTARAMDDAQEKDENTRG